MKDDLVKVYNDGYFYKYLMSHNRDLSVMELVSAIEKRVMRNNKMNIELKDGFESIDDLIDIYEDGYLCVYLICRINTAKPSDMEVVSIFVNHTEAGEAVEEWNKKINKCKNCPYCDEELNEALSKKGTKDKKYNCFNPEVSKSSDDGDIYTCRTYEEERLPEYEYIRVPYPISFDHKDKYKYEKETNAKLIDARATSATLKNLSLKDNIYDDMSSEDASILISKAGSIIEYLLDKGLIEKKFI